MITRTQDLPAHEEQRRRTLTLIAQFDDRGQTALADQNRVVLDQLDARITQIKATAAAAALASTASAGHAADTAAAG